MPTCLYCSNAADSGEHLFPDWLNKVLGYDEPTFLFLGPKGWKSEKPATLKVRVVCEGCNNGWMSDIEKEAKPVLTPMILGQSCRLEVAHQRTIAKWAFARAVIGEHLPGRQFAIPHAHRDWLRDHDEAPSQAHVVVAATDGNWWLPGNGRVGNVHFSNGMMVANADHTHVSPTLVKGAVVGYYATILIRHLALQVVGTVVIGGGFAHPAPLVPFLTEVSGATTAVDWPAASPMSRPEVEHLIGAWRGDAPYRTPWVSSERVDQLADGSNRKTRRATKRRK